MNIVDYYKKSDTVIGIAKILFNQLRNDYKEVKIKEVCDSSSGGTPKRGIPDYYNGEIPWLKSGELNDGLIVKCKEYITEKGLKNSSAKLFPKGTLLVAMYGATAGKTGFLNFDSTTNQAVCALYPKEKLNIDYFYWFLRQHRLNFIIQSKGGAQPNISQTVIKQTRIPLPSLEKQKEIVNFLYKTDKTNVLDSKSIFLSDFSKKQIEKYFLIRNSNEFFENQLITQKHLLTKLKQSILQDAIQGKLTADWRSTKQLLSFEGEVPQAERFKTTPQVPQAERFKTTPQVPQAEKFKKTTQAQQPEDFKTDPQAQQAEQSKNAPTTLEDSSQNFSKHRGRINNLPHLKTFRKTLRNNLTPAEATLWKALKGKQLQGRKFRRQFSVANYILDFYCPAEKLAIELDGQGHFEATQAIYDQERDLFLNHCGINVLRFENKWVWNNMEAVLQEIQYNFDWENNPSVLRTAPLKEEQYIEPASELLKRIKAEKAQLIKEKKIKKEKPLPPITKDDIPFELPEGWVWCRLGEVSTYLNGNGFNSSDFTKGNGVKCIKITNAGVKEVIETDDTLPIEYLEKHKTYLVYENDIILALTRPYISAGLKVSLCPKSYNKSLLNQRVAVIRGFEIQNKYIYTFLQSSFVLEGYKKEFSTTGQQPNLRTDHVTNLLFPLPPLSEQKEIVKKVDALMQHCQALEQEIHTSETNAQMLMQAVLKEAFEGQTAHTDE